MKAVISYIKEFLIGGKHATALSSYVGYTADPREFYKYRVVIVPSPFFKTSVYGTEASMPTLPLQEVEGVPLLFGLPETAWVETTLVVHADIIAGAYFLLTRYEEIRRREVRDAHGRFPGKESLPYKAGFIHRPIVDEYGFLLREWLRQSGAVVSEPEKRINKIWLTHDVDVPFYSRTFRRVVAEAVKGIGLKKALSMYKGAITSDPYYTFPWLAKINRSLKEVAGKNRCSSVFFIKAGGNATQDKPVYRLDSKDIQALFALCQSENISIGLHSSYESGKNPKQVPVEKKLLEKALKKTIRLNRHHYLSSREPDDFNWLEMAGITDDFTMGYADVAGFRLGTCRPVRWISPLNKRLSEVVLHPLIIMDCTLSEPHYMNLNYEEALQYCRELITQVENVHGELTLLWHNNTVATEVKPTLSVDWQRKLYTSLIEDLKQR